MATTPRTAPPGRVQHPYADPAARAKAREISEDIDSIIAQLRVAVERWGWNDPYVISGLEHVEHLERWRRHVLGMMKDAS